MQIQISFRHIEDSQSLRDYATAQSEKLKKFFQGRIHVTWTFTQERQNTVAHCHLVGNHMDYFGEAAVADSRGAVDLAVDRIEAQLRKHKDIVSDRRHGPTVNVSDEE